MEADLEAINVKVHVADLLDDGAAPENVVAVPRGRDHLVVDEEHDRPQRPTVIMTPAVGA